MEEHQLSTSATLDSSLHRIHNDMHQLAGNLLDIAERLEDRLNVLAEGKRGNGEHQAPLPRKSNLPAAADGWQGVLPTTEGMQSGVPAQQQALQPQKTGLSDGLQQALPPSASKQIRGSVVGRGSGGNYGLKGSRQDILAVPEDELAQNQPQSLECVPDQAANNSEQSDAQKSNSGGACNARRWRQSLEATPEDEKARVKPQEIPVVAAQQLDMDSRFGVIDKKLDQILGAVGVRLPGENDDDDDRKRLKEKLKA
jgi:hypothetical protein